MREVGEIDDRDVEHAEERIARAGLAAGQINAACGNYPVRMRQAAVGHRPANDTKFIRAVLDDDAASKEKRIGGGVDDLLAADVLAHAHAAGHVVEASG